MFYGEILRMNILKINKLLNLILIFMLAYTLITFVGQQSKLNSYNKDIARNNLRLLLNHSRYSATAKQQTYNVFPLFLLHPDLHCNIAF